MKAGLISAIIAGVAPLAFAAALAAEQPRFHTLDEAMGVVLQGALDARTRGGEDDEATQTAFRTKAQTGDVDAQFGYAMWLSTKSKKEQADFWARKAAEQGFPPAQYLLGIDLITGAGGKKNIGEGRHWLLLSAQSGFATSQNDLGTLCYQSGDYKCAREWYEKASEFEVSATSVLGRMYYFGKGGSVDKFKARELLTRAAERKDAPSEYLLASMNFSGEGGEKNVNKARDYALASDEDGYPDAPVLLTDIYLNGGSGFQPDPTEARKWAMKGAEAGNADSQAELAIFYGNGTGGEANLEKSRQWNIKAAQAGQKNAMYNLGVMLCNGQGGPSDYREAKRWFLKAAQSGMPEAEHNLGALYQNGWGVPVDLPAARSWFSKAASQGFGPSRAALANLDRSTRGSSRASGGSVFGSMMCSKMLTGRAFSAAALMGPC